MGLKLKAFLSQKEVIERLKEPSTHSGLAVIQLVGAFVMYQYTELDIEAIFLLVAFFNGSLAVVLREKGEKGKNGNDTQEG